MVEAGIEQQVCLGLSRFHEAERHNVPGSEAPAEMMFFIPRLNAFCAAEDATHTLHNLYTFLILKRIKNCNNFNKVSIARLIH